MKQVRHLPGRHALNRPSTAQRLAHFESIPFIDPDIAADLSVERSAPECLNARAVEKHVPAMEFLRRRDQGESGASQLRGPALRVGDKESRQVRLSGARLTARSYVAIEMAGLSRESLQCWHSILP